MANEIIVSSVVSPFHSRSRKLNEQRCLIQEKNIQKRKFSGKISSLPPAQTVSLSPIIESNFLDYPQKFSQYNNVPLHGILNPGNEHKNVSYFPKSSTAGGDISTIQIIPPSNLDSIVYSEFKHDILEFDNAQVISNTSKENSAISTDNPDNLISKPITSKFLLFDMGIMENNDFSSDISCIGPKFDIPPSLSPLLMQTKSVSAASPILNLSDFVSSPAIDSQVHYCQIQRHKRGIDNNIFPIYELFLENCNTNENIFILASRRRKKSKLCNYLITTSQQDLSRGGPGYVGKLRANFLGTGFILFSNRNDPHDDSAFRDGNNFREVLCSIQYEQNIMGLRGPRKMTVLLPVVAEGTRVHISESLSENSLSDQYLKNPDLILVLENKMPDWNSSSQTYNLNFNGRVTQASVKNFQLIDSRDGRVVMQFGRIGKDLFTLDYSYPLCPLQAFGIALSSFERKFACE